MVNHKLFKLNFATQKRSHKRGGRSTGGSSIHNMHCRHMSGKEGGGWRIPSHCFTVECCNSIVLFQAYHRYTVDCCNSIVSFQAYTDQLMMCRRRYGDNYPLLRHQLSGLPKLCAIISRRLCYRYFDPAHRRSYSPTI